MIATALALLAALAAPAAERTRVVQLAPGVDGPAEPLPLYFDQRLTLVMPGPVRLAVPGSPDVVTAHVRDQLVVLSLVDSEFVRVRRPTTNLTVLTADGTPFTCRLSVAASAAEAGVDLVRVLPDPGKVQRAGPEAVALVEAWLRDGARALPEDVRPTFAPLAAQIDARARRQVAGWVARDGAERLADTRRTKRAFVYLTSHGLVRVGPFLAARLSVTNHTQPPFTVGAVRVRAGGAELTDAVVEVPDRVVAPDGEPRGLGVLLPAAALAEGAALEVDVCEADVAGRCVAIEVR